jgi:hypothetical protein
MKKKIDFIAFNLLWCITSFIFPFLLLWNNFNLPQLFVISFSIYFLDVNNNTTEDYLKYQIKFLDDKYDKFVRSIVKEKYEKYINEYWATNPNGIGMPMSYETWFKNNYE